MKQKTITKLIGAFITLCGIGMGIASIPWWGFIVAVGILVVLVGSEEKRII